MSEITLSIPDEALVALKVKPDQLGAELRLAAAVKLLYVSWGGSLRVRRPNSLASQGRCF
jgi:hypothetical protein